MRKSVLLAGIVALAAVAQPAFAQHDDHGAHGTTFRGVRIEGDIGGDRFQSQGRHHNKLGFGGTVGFDGTIHDRLVIGAEGTYWRPDGGNENCGPAGATTVCHKSFEEWGAAVRTGYLVSPQLLVFAKGGYVTNEQRKRITGPTGAPLLYDHFNTVGYQFGGGVEYSLTNFGSMPVYLNAQYTRSQYNDHTKRQRLTAGIGIRFK
jgi:outer membrane immunogenic protein